jgi:DNA polymerase
MSDELRKLLKEALNDQKNVFGDLLFERLNYKVQEERSEEVEEEPTYFQITESKVVETESHLFKEDFQKAETLDEVYDLIKDCTKCSLGETRNKFVFGSGNPNADVMLIGEAPGAEEDKQGLPFVGRAGKLLTDILKAINFSREDVYIANILKCRPPNNRDPKPDEIETCRPHLNKQMDLIKPKVILCLGKVAANSLLNKRESLSNFRGNVYEYNNTKVMVTYHPAALLRNPQWKRRCWEDVQQFRKLYDKLTGNS